MRCAYYVKLSFKTPPFNKELKLAINASVFYFRYRAVASWSRVQGIGVPLITAIEIITIWILSFVLAIPEAIGFTTVEFEYNGNFYVSCMLLTNTTFLSVCIKIQPQVLSFHLQRGSLEWWDKRTKNGRRGKS